MTTLSVPLSGRRLLGEALPPFRREPAHDELPRPRLRRVPDPKAVVVPGLVRTVTVKIASELDELEQAFRLVAANYQERGYEAQTGKPFRFTPYHALPNTTVFVAKLDGRVVATFSLVADNVVLGLPMESIYSAEIADLRRQGRRMAEVTSLAFSDLGQREFLQVFTAMIRVMKQYHVAQGGDTWVITVNPRHSNFYTKVLGYRPLGECKPYAAVGDAPAEAYWLDAAAMRVNAPRGYAQIFGEDLPPEVLTAPPLPRPFIRYFGTESSQTDESRTDAILRTVAAVGGPRAW